LVELLWAHLIQKKKKKIKKKNFLENVEEGGIPVKGLKKKF